MWSLRDAVCSGDKITSPVMSKWRIGQNVSCHSRTVETKHCIPSNVITNILKMNKSVSYETPLRERKLGSLRLRPQSEDALTQTGLFEYRS
jgi:hypothetical protein